MIELFVNNHEVLLPENFEVVIIEENPEITNNGEFTLDITLTLLEAKNAIAFGFLNRKNLTTISKSADARMIVDGEVRYGTVVILSNTDIDVTFQFVAGNSELNYNTKADGRKIWELDWGTESAISFSRAWTSTLTHLYDNRFGAYAGMGLGYTPDFVCAPVKIGEDIYNNYKFIDGVDFDTSSQDISSVERILMQPWLLYYINKLPALMGYTMATNANILNTDERAKRMYLLNTVDSLNYADALPDMTISEFIDAVENFFNVNFLINSVNKTVSIINTKSNLSAKKIVNIANAVDGYNRDLDPSTVPSKIGFTKIKYEFSDSLYFKYQQIEPEIKKRCEIVDVSTFSGIFNYLSSHNLQLALNPTIIFNVLDEGNSYFYGDANIELYRKHSSIYFENLIDKFKDWGTSEDSILYLKIKPSEIEGKVMTLHYTDSAHINVPLKYQYPKSSNSYYIEQTGDMVEMVEKTIKNPPRIDFLEVSLYAGSIIMHHYSLLVPWNKHFYYPFSFSDIYPDFGPSDGDDFNDYTEFEAWISGVFRPNTHCSMRIKEIVEDYRTTSILDTTKEYTFILVDSPDVRADNIFVIDGRKYMPISLERKKSNKSATVTGKFYAMLAQ